MEVAVFVTLYDSPVVFSHRLVLPVIAEVVGLLLEVIVTSDVEDGQEPLLIVHLIVEEPPTVKPVTPEVGSPGVVTVAVPLTTDQRPVPVVGVFAANVAVVTLQNVWSAPEEATVGP